MQMQTNFHMTRFEKEAKGNSEMAYWRSKREGSDSQKSRNVFGCHNFLYIFVMPRF